MIELWTAPPVERTSAPRQCGERDALEAWLDYHRDTLLLKCSGLTAEQLKEKTVPPSTLSLLGLVRHMTNVERWWFRIHAANEEIDKRYSSTGAWEVEGADAEADLEVFRQEINEARAAVRDKQLDEVVPGHGKNAGQDRDVRWIYLHMIEEYARHNGHADLLRERIDGTTGD